MTKTIGNPLSWAVGVLGSTVGYGASVAGSVAAHPAEVPQVRRISIADLHVALRKGGEDMAEFRSDVIFACLLYPVIGVALAALAVQGNLLHLMFPALSGFALVGPLAAVGLYEMSRRREQGLEAGWGAYLDVLRSPKFGAIVVLGLFHLMIFAVWIMVANLIFDMTMGPEGPVSLAAFAQDVVSTGAGWAMIVIGMTVGFGFAAAVLAISIVSFPLLLDRDVGLPLAVVTSVRVALKNPVPVAVWGLIVAVLLMIGSLPALLGLILVMPLLGHATWHLYRAAVM